MRSPFATALVRITVEKPHNLPDDSSRRSTAHSFSARSRAKALGVTRSKYVSMSASMASRSARSSASTRRTSPATARASERGDLDVGKSSVDSFTVSPNIVPVYVEECAAVLHVRVRPRDANIRVVGRKSDEEVIVVGLGGMVVGSSKERGEGVLTLGADRAGERAPDRLADRRQVRPPDDAHRRVVERANAAEQRRVASHDRLLECALVPEAKDTGDARLRTRDEARIADGERLRR